MTAVKAVRTGEFNISEDSCCLISRFPKGAWRLVVCSAGPVPSWNLDLVLKALAYSPFGPLTHTNLEMIGGRWAMFVTLVL